MTYKVIEHNNTKALRQEPDMEIPNATRYSSSNVWLYGAHMQTYEAHLSDCAKNIIDIAPEFQDKWETGQSVEDSEFEIVQFDHVFIEDYTSEYFENAEPIKAGSFLKSDGNKYSVYKSDGIALMDCFFYDEFLDKGFTKPTGIVAIPKQPLLEEKEEGLYSFQDLIDWTQHLGEMGWYMEKSGRWVHDDEAGHFETTKDLVEHYRPIQKNEKEEGLWSEIIFQIIAYSNYPYTENGTFISKDAFISAQMKLYHITRKSKQ